MLLLAYLFLWVSFPAHLTWKNLSLAYLVL